MARKLTDLDKKILAKLDKASKVTSDDVLHKLDTSSDNAQKRFRETVRPGVEIPLSHKIEIVLIIILVFLLGFMGLRFSSLGSHHRQIMDSAELKIGSETKKASSLDRIIADLPSMDTMKTVLVDVSTAGNKLADIQNKFIELVPPPADDAPANREYTAKARELAAQTRELIEDSTLKSATFAIDNAWFKGYVTDRTGYTEPKDPHSYKWVYPANYKIQAGSTDVVGVVWLCKETSDDSKIYAWVTADYYPKLGKFAHLEFAKTAFGQALTPATNEGPPSLKHQLSKVGTPEILTKKIPAYIYNQYGDKSGIPKDMVDWSQTTPPSLTNEQLQDQKNLALLESAREQYRLQNRNQPTPSTIGKSVPPNKLAPLLSEPHPVPPPPAQAAPPSPPAAPVAPAQPVAPPAPPAPQAPQPPR